MKWPRMLVVLGVCLAVAAQVQAQPQTTRGEQQTEVQLGPRIGMDLGDVTDPYLGLDARIATSQLSPLVVNPTFDYFLSGDEQGLWSLSGTLLYPFGVSDRPVSFYGGAGLGFYRFSTSRETPDTPFREGSEDVGVNFLLGTMRESDSPITPFAEFQFTTLLADPSPTLFGFKGGLLIRF